MKLNTLLFSLFFVLVVSCKKENIAPVDTTPEPTADFLFTPSGGRAPIEISFINTSSNATSYKWEFGNGKASTEKEPSMVFELAGTYTVKLTAINGTKQNTISKTVTIQTPYTGVSITKIVVKEVCPKNLSFTTDDWDAKTPTADYGYPDVFPRVTWNGTTTALWSSSNYVLNASPAKMPISFTPTSLILSDLSRAVDIDLYDYESSTILPEYMESCTFKPTDYNKGADAYPTTVRLIKENGAGLNQKYEIELTLSWR